MLSRAGVVELARSWLDVPFVHQGRTRANHRKQGGVDCAGLIILVACEAGHLPDGVDVPAYHRKPDGKTIRAMLADYTLEVGLSDVQPGDIVCLKWELSRFPQHMAWVSSLSGGRLGLIHSSFEHRRVVEHGYDQLWRGRTVSCHCLPGLKEEMWPS